MRLTVTFALACALGGMVSAVTGAPAEAQRNRVVCIAPNNPNCRTACSSNRPIICFAQFQNGRCSRYCGPPR